MNSITFDLVIVIGLFEGNFFAVIDSASLISLYFMFVNNFSRIVGVDEFYYDRSDIGVNIVLYDGIYSINYGTIPLIFMSFNLWCD